MRLTADILAQIQMVTSFYTHNGLSFGDFDDILTGTFVPSTLKYASFPYADFFRGGVGSKRSPASLYSQ
jgi:hypothetical protein